MSARDGLRPAAMTVAMAALRALVGGLAVRGVVAAAARGPEATVAALHGRTVTLLLAGFLGLTLVAFAAPRTVLPGALGLAAGLAVAAALAHAAGVALPGADPPMLLALAVLAARERAQAWLAARRPPHS